MILHTHTHEEKIFFIYLLVSKLINNIFNYMYLQGSWLGFEVPEMGRGME